ncbi:MAG TPA: translation initiation factor IF-2 subunit gamma [Candidatus Norongarragalinales archaeon]|nr:translation initiation factor IF-2 subunit gamma [Candidatus Norongarragalinales archaeon]
MPQAEVNIGTVGHVDHGKTTLVAALTKKWTDTHSEEVKRGITIKLGYADVVFKKCEKCAGFEGYTAGENCENCGGAAKPVRKISFVDSPGHETLMATVIAASSIMDGALFVIAANEKCPMPQTAEHLMVLEAAGIRNVVIAQNKVDLVSKQRALENYNEIRAFLKGTPYEDSAIIPTAAHSPKSLSALIEAIETSIPTPKRHPDADPFLYIARSFDVNKPGAKIERLVGAVFGGSIVKGQIKIGDEIELAPGILKKKKDRENYEILKTKVVGLFAENEKLEEASPGGLVGLSTSLDPALSKSDGLVGNLVGKAGTLPEAKYEIKVEIEPLKRAIESFNSSPGINEPLVLGIGTNTTIGFIIERKKKAFFLKLKKPVCANAKDKLAIMRRANNRWHLYGVATIVA